VRREPLARDSSTSETRSALFIPSPHAKALTSTSTSACGRQRGPVKLIAYTLSCGDGQTESCNLCDTTFPGYKGPEPLVAGPDAGKCGDPAAACDDSADDEADGFDAFSADNLFDTYIARFDMTVSQGEGNRPLQVAWPQTVSGHSPPAATWANHTAHTARPSSHTRYSTISSLASCCVW
jgi:hypothetical protein